MQAEDLVKNTSLVLASLCSPHLVRLAINLYSIRGHHIEQFARFDQLIANLSIPASIHVIMTIHQPPDLSAALVELLDHGLPSLGPCKERGITVTLRYCNHQPTDSHYQEVAWK